MKNNIIKHLTIRLVIPVSILFLIWILGGLNYRGLEEILFFSFFSGILIFIFSIFIINETIFFYQEKNLTLRNINIALLILSIPFFVFMAIVAVAVLNF
jgi:hypothetical protein